MVSQDCFCFDYWRTSAAEARSPPSGGGGSDPTRRTREHVERSSGGTSSENRCFIHHLQRECTPGDKSDISYGKGHLKGK
ncbi:hypothetical protein MHYP_G00297840 [Metynnis hypsauchen]